MLHMYTKFEDNIYVCSSVITKNVFFFFHLQRNIVTLWRHSVTSSITSSPWKYFFLQNLRWSFYFSCQFEAVCNILTFSKWPPFWGFDEIFTTSDTGIWICYKDSHEHLWHFELLIGALAQILTDLFHFKILTYLTSSMTHSTIVCKGVFTIQWYISTLSFKMISLFVLQ